MYPLWVEKAWVAGFWLTPGRHHPAQANKPIINKHRGGKWLSAQTHPSFHLTPVSAFYRVINQVFSRHYSMYQTSWGPISFGKVHENSSILSSSLRLLRYHYSNAGWSAGLKISPMYNGKRRQAVNLLQASKPCENRTRLGWSGWFLLLSFGRKESPPVFFEPFENHLTFWGPNTPKTTLLVEVRTDWTIHSI